MDGNSRGGAGRRHHARAASQSAWDAASSGTYDDTALPVVLPAVFTALVFVALLVPFLGMAWAPTQTTTENRTLAPAPQLTTATGEFNFSVLSDAGAYFDDHFAFRNQMVTVNAKARALLLTSSTDQAVVGTQGWLYYGGTLPDYLGQSQLSERGLRNVAHNLATAQDYVSAHGADFLFVVAPNKNSLYADDMPYYYLPADAVGNFERLKPFLDDQGVHYVDLHSLLENQGETLYLKTDSHWSNEGALLATDTMLESLSHETTGVDASSAVERNDFQGDIASMLYPAEAGSEANQYYPGYNTPDDSGALKWEYVEGQDVTDNWVQTQGEGGEGNLLMFRDSFGNAILPYWATSFDKAAFSRLVPYNLPMLMQVDADTVVVERAERHLAYLAQNAPLMPSPRVSLSNLPIGDAADADGTTLSAYADGPYVVLKGVIDSRATSDDMAIYVSVQDAEGESGLDLTVFEAFWLSTVDEAGADAGDFGYQVTLNANTVDVEHSVVRVYGVSGGKTTCLRTFNSIAVAADEGGEAGEQAADGADTSSTDAETV